MIPVVPGGIADTMLVALKAILNTQATLDLPRITLTGDRFRYEGKPSRMPPSQSAEDCDSERGRDHDGSNSALATV